jgi:hypothetical protein
MRFAVTSSADRKQSLPASLSAFICGGLGYGRSAATLITPSASHPPLPRSVSSSRGKIGRSDFCASPLSCAPIFPTRQVDVARTRARLSQPCSRPAANAGSTGRRLRPRARAARTPVSRTDRGIPPPRSPRCCPDTTSLSPPPRDGPSSSLRSAVHTPAPRSPPSPRATGPRIRGLPPSHPQPGTTGPRLQGADTGRLR